MLKKRHLFSDTYLTSVNGNGIMYHKKRRTHPSPKKPCPARVEKMLHFPANSFFGKKESEPKRLWTLTVTMFVADANCTPNVTLV